MILNEEFIVRMKALLGDEFEDFLISLEKEPIKAFRVNTDKISLEDFEKINIFGRERIPYVDNGFYLNYDKAGNHPYHHAGMIYIQEPAAMVPAECIEVNPDWKVLDMCASPGGKSTQIKNKLGDNGILVSNEIVFNRAKVLAGNIERLGLKNCVIMNKDSGSLTKIFPKTFDLIMVDAPCSGEGMFRKEEAAINDWSVENIERCASRQKEILSNAALCLKDGGYIVYSTCTYSLEENEMIIADFLDNNPDFELIPVNDKILKYSSDGIRFDGCKIKNINYCRRLYPHINKGEGQFVAVLSNINSVNYCENSHIKNNNSALQFLDEVLTEYNSENVFNKGSQFYYFTPDFNVDISTAFSFGVYLGEQKKNYFMPSHQLFMALGNNFKNKIFLTADSIEIKKYLHGEEFNCELSDGWAAVIVDGCTVGGVKVSNNIAKNHYPKGLRTLY